MNRKSKIGIFFALVLFLLFGFCSRESISPISKSLRSNLAYLPGEAKGIGYINFESLKKSPVGQNLLHSWEENNRHSEDFQELMQESGLDPQRNLKEVFFCLTTVSQQPGHPNGLLIATGKFDSKKIMTYLKKKDTEVEIEEFHYQKYRLFQLAGDKISFCFPKKDLILAGQEDAVKEALDKMEKSVKISRDLFRKIKNLKYKNGAWLTLNVQPLLKDLPANQEYQEYLKQFKGFKSIEDLNVSVNFEKITRLNSRGNFNNPEDSQLIFDAMKGIVATAKLSLSANRKLVDLLNSIKLERDGKRIEMNFSFTKEDVERLKNKEKFFSSF